MSQQAHLNIEDVDRKDDTAVGIAEVEHDHVDLKAGATTSVGLALIEQTNVLPTTGARKVTTKWEYWTYCAFCKDISLRSVRKLMTLQIWERMVLVSSCATIGSSGG
jgi:hypothetical protein